MPGPGLSLEGYKNRFMPREGFRSNLELSKVQRITVSVNTKPKNRAAGKQVRLTSHFARAFNPILTPASPEQLPFIGGVKESESPE